jgi:hypothetical protein
MIGFRHVAGCHYEESSSNYHDHFSKYELSSHTKSLVVHQEPGQILTSSVQVDQNISLSSKKQNGKIQEKTDSVYLVFADSVLSLHS